MSAVTLTLGGVVFQGFEIPDSIRVGGQHQLVTHKLPGGARTIDAMGRDDRDIGWSGRFRGYAAESRSRTLDDLRIAGKPLVLTWAGFRYTVLIQSYEADYQAPFEIPYSINCLVQSDDVSPIVALPQGLDSIINGDLASLTGLPITLAGVTDSITALQSVAATVGNVRTASKGGLLSLVGAVSAAQSTTGSAIGTIEGSLGVPAPANATAIAAQLSGQAAAFGQIDQLYQASSVLGRLGKNLAG